MCEFIFGHVSTTMTVITVYSHQIKIEFQLLAFYKHTHATDKIIALMPTNSTAFTLFCITIQPWDGARQNISKKPVSGRFNFTKL